MHVNSSIRNGNEDLGHGTKGSNATSGFVAFESLVEHHWHVNAEHEAPVELPVIPDFEIHSLLGIGGMGVVYRGHDTKLDRDLAIKVMRRQLLSKTNVLRFVHEASLCGQLEHPCIVPVHRLEFTVDGVPYFTMKLVKGLSLLQLLEKTWSKSREDSGSPSMEYPRYYRLFEQLAHGVSYAHAQGVIHRDLKPSNIMVGAFGELQIMDWGLAKRHKNQAGATSTQIENQESPDSNHSDSTQNSSADTSQSTVPSFHPLDVTYTGDTRDGGLLGTVAYMPPEQARGELSSLDERCDVFSLGAILCEIITGKPPYEHGTGTSDLDAAKQGDVTLAIRAIENAGVDKDITALARACLAPDRELRPRSAKEIASRMSDHLASVQARLQEAEIQTAVVNVKAVENLARLKVEQKARRRAVWIAVTTVVGLVATIVLATWALYAENNAVTERDAKGLALQAEQKANETIKVQLKQVERGIKLLASVFKGLNPRTIDKQGRTLREALADQLGDAVKELKGEAVGNAVAVARLQSTLGSALNGLGYTTKARTVLEESKATLVAQLSLDNEFTLDCMNELAQCYSDLDDHEMALSIHMDIHDRKKAQLGAVNPSTLMSMSNIGMEYIHLAKYDLARPIMLEVTSLCEKHCGPMHSHTIHSFYNLAGFYKTVGEIHNALPLFQRSYESMKEKFGPSHVDTLTALNNIASCHRMLKQFDEALPLFEAVLKLKKDTLAHDHPSVLASCNDLALCYQQAGELDKAISLFEESLRLMRIRRGPDHSETIAIMSNLAVCYRTRGKYDLALPLLTEVLKYRKSKLGNDHPDTIVTLTNLATFLRGQNKHKEALPLYKEAAEAMEAKRFQYQHAVGIVRNYCECLEELNQHSLAETWRRKILVIEQSRAGKQTREYAAGLSGLGNNFIEQKKWSDAEVVLQECFSIRKIVEPNHWITFITQSQLGTVYLGLKKYELATELLQAGYRGLIQREAALPKYADQSIIDALESLVQLADALGQEQEKAKWKSELETRNKKRSKPSK